jgi:hypothetical protein
MYIILLSLLFINILFFIFSNNLSFLLFILIVYINCSINNPYAIIDLSINIIPCIDCQTITCWNNYFVFLHLNLISLYKYSHKKQPSRCKRHSYVCKQQFTKSQFARSAILTHCPYIFFQ